MCTLFCVFACAALALRCAADDVPSVDALRAKVAAAAGTEPASTYERITLTRSGVSGSSTIVRSGDDFRETDGYGPLRTAFGSIGKQRWHQNANGQTVLEQPDPGVAAKEVYTTSVSRISSPFDAYVIAKLNAAGSGTKEYIDPATSRIVRLDEITPTQTTVTTYDDFRTVAGYTTAWRWSVRDGHPENDADYQIQTLVARPVLPDEIAVAPPGRALVEFPAGKAAVDLPVQYVNGRFFVRVMIAGRGLDFLLDTGAAGIFIDESVARQLGLKDFATTTDASSAGRIATSTVVVPEMDVGELRMRAVAVETLPSDLGAYDGLKVVGLLGFDFIAELLLRLDYEHGTVSASQTDLAFASLPKGSIVLDVRLGEQAPLATVAINGAPGERFMIDTGDEGGIMIFDYFARRNPHAIVDEGGGSYEQREMQFRGVGGDVDIRPYQLARVTVGKVNFRDFMAYRVTERKSYAGDDDGLIGAEELRFFTVWVDYVHSRIVMIPNADGRDAMK